MLELRVENMTCGGCARHVTQAVQSVDSNARVDVDLAGKKVRVETQADPEAVAAAIAEEGYPATLVRAG
ncbi:MAG TPA: heavy-metal-associated domain-containing protein [Noviherbaspirillum sp.]|nr:heavy-metal-associated domain-containing protein [Noviherbaspirillum sp.]